MLSSVVSKSLTRPGAAASQRMGIEEGRRLSEVLRREHEWLATAFPGEHPVQQGQVVESQRLSETGATVKTRQRARAAAMIAEPSTTRRKVRLSRASVPRRTSTNAAAKGWAAIE